MRLELGRVSQVSSLDVEFCGGFTREGKKEYSKMIWPLFCHEKLRATEWHLKIGKEFQGVT